MPFDISEWGTKNVTVNEPTGFLTSEWGTANATLLNPTTDGTSDWGTENVTLLNGSSSDWGTANAVVEQGGRFYEWRLATGAGWVPARFMAFVPDTPTDTEYTSSAWGTENATVVDTSLSYRDYLLQPYNSSSIWNTPIGTLADEVTADLPVQFNSAGKVSVDPIHLAMTPGAPIRQIRNGTTLNHTTMPVLSASATIGNPGVADPRVHIGDSITHNSGWNGIFGGLDADDITLAWTGQALNRLTATDQPQIYRTGSGYPTGNRGHDDLLGDGRKGAHGGGQCGGIGGTLRDWEYDAALAGDVTAIKHRLAINTYSPTSLSQANQGFGAGLSGDGWRWPAYKADSDFTTPGANNYYGRTGVGYDGVVMGSLLALPGSYPITGIADPVAAALAWTLKNFGCQIVDVVGLTPRYAFSVENNRKAAWDGRSVSAFHQPLMTLITSLVLIDDCMPATPGGAGSPRTTPPLPLAP